MKTIWICGLIGLFALVGCKTPQKTVTTTYADFKEDLAPYRQIVQGGGGAGAPAKPANPNGQLPKNPSNTQVVESKRVYINQPPVQPQMAVTSVVDSKLLQIARRNAEISRLQGFRLQIYSGNSRMEAERIFSKLRMVYEADLNYEQPNYKVKVGNFLNRLDAHEELVKLESEYPQAIIIADVVKINLDEYLKD